ncbi:MAG: hypothetical protein J6Y62_03900 [Clostridia bacterium]|nr:hypothetical protein [Clostridia bacterium]
MSKFPDREIRWLRKNGFKKARGLNEYQKEIKGLMLTASYPMASAFNVRAVCPDPVKGFSREASGATVEKALSALCLEFEGLSVAAGKAAFDVQPKGEGLSPAEIGWLRGKGVSNIEQEGDLWKGKLSGGVPVHVEICGGVRSLRIGDARASAEGEGDDVKEAWWSAVRNLSAGLAAGQRLLSAMAEAEDA